MDTVRDLIEQLKEKGVTCAEISRRIDYHESAITKVARGVQSDLPYTIGKQIENLNKKTRMRK